MTFLSARFRIPEELTMKELEKLDRLNTMYGIRSLSIQGQTLFVEYDASRIHEAEALAAVNRTGILAQPEKPIPPGSIDDSGEFQDFAWPTQGLSPANQKLK